MTPADTDRWLAQEKALRSAWVGAIHRRASIDTIKAAQRAYVEFMTKKNEELDPRVDETGV